MTGPVLQGTMYLADPAVISFDIGKLARSFFQLDHRLGGHAGVPPRPWSLSDIPMSNQVFRLIN